MVRIKNAGRPWSWHQTVTILRGTQVETGGAGSRRHPLTGNVDLGTTAAAERDATTLYDNPSGLGRKQIIHSPHLAVPLSELSSGNANQEVSGERQIRDNERA
ncbi:MAG: hypothetical protein EOS78_29390 [Mesorhizobium sp.]|nr:MAG: hypothetical protein EOS78_29390 [Mesorhizobium sp.]